MRLRTRPPLLTYLLSLHTYPSVPAVRVASFYGPHWIRDKHTCEPVLDPILSRNLILLRDFNAVTEASHTTALKPNIWPWLVAKERSSAPSDLLLPHSPHTPYTRMHRYGGSKSYIDPVYGSRLFCALFLPSAASVLGFSRVPGAQDHDPVVVRTVPWTVPNALPPRCALWNRRDVKRFQRGMSTPSPQAEPLIAPESVQTVCQSLARQMLEAMRVVNDSHAPTREPDPPVTDWDSVVNQPAKQAKRRSKLFYRRVKHSLLSPPPSLPSLSPAVKSSAYCTAIPSGRRTQRLSFVWLSASTTSPPILLELRSLARAARKKSPGPDGVPPYLLYMLPDSALSVIHSCLVTCYDSGTLPCECLVSGTFCLFRGRAKWQDPDRWRPIAMSNSIYRPLMRWVHTTLYSLHSPQLHPRQFCGKQGHSPAQATHAFMHDVGQFDRREAILAFDVYHAFDSFPETPHLHSPRQSLYSAQVAAHHFPGTRARSQFYQGHPE